MKILAIALALIFAAPTIASAKKKDKTPRTSAQAKKKKDETPPVGDKSTNEGAQGRKNATEGAAQDTDSPAFQGRP